VRGELAHLGAPVALKRQGRLKRLDIFVLRPDEPAASSTRLLHTDELPDTADRPEQA